MRLVAPNGKLITGTVETIPACEAGIVNEGVTQNADGTFNFDYSGDTEVNWNGQRTDRDENGRRLFYDEDGNVHAENTLTLIAEAG